MTSINLGDLAQHFMLRRHNADLKATMTTLTEELASGVRSDVSDAVTGDYSYLADIERSLTIMNGYSQSVNEARLFTDATQSSLEQIQNITSDLGATLITAASSNSTVTFRAVSLGAEQDFRSVVSAMNANVAGRSLFSGNVTDTSPLTDADVILDELRTVVAGLTSPADVQTAVDDWFNAPGGGFETVAYQGSDTDLSPYLLGEGDSVRFELRADSQEMRDLLRDTALAALVGDDAIGLDTASQKSLIQSTGENLMTAQGGLINVRADLGFVEERIDEAAVRNSASQSSLELARSELIAADPYETATRLENTRQQLETLYAVTVRLSSLTLADYLR